MVAHQPSPEVRLELWVREAVPDGALPGHTDAIDRVRALLEEGAVAGLEVNVWGRHVCLPVARQFDGTAGRIVDAVRAFERWAVRNGCVLGPGFERRERSSFFEEGSHEVIVLPTVCLAIFEGDELCDVYPSVDGDDVRTVRDGLAILGATSHADREREGSALADGG